MKLSRLWDMLRFYPFELEDIRWFPPQWRTFMTDYLRILSERLGLYDAAADVLTAALANHPSPRILDLCSGSGGPAIRIRRLVEEKLNRKIPLTLSDKYVQLTAIPGAFDFICLDARNASRSLPGFRTLFTSFHHFSKDAARQIIEEAAREGSGLAIFELTDRRPLTFLLVILTPIYVLALTPFIRPFSLHRILATYLVPIIPIAATWDGIISNFRSYTRNDLLSLCQGLPRFEWHSGTTSSKLGVRLTYLIGVPFETAFSESETLPSPG